MNQLTEVVKEMLLELGVTTRHTTDGAGGSDLIATIPTRSGPRDVGIQVKWRSQPLGPAEAAHWHERHPFGTILALPSVPAGTGRRYRALGINYIDSGGNAFLDFPGFHVHIEGRKPQLEARIGTKAQPASTNPAGLKVSFVLLTNPETVAFSHEALSGLAQVSKGTVTNALADLRQRGHIFEGRSRRELVGRPRLARDWVDGYVRVLAPRLRTLQLMGPEPDWWIRTWDDPTVATIGGGPALTHLGANLRADTTVLYGTPPWSDVRRRARLTREGDGARVILRERFWSPEFLSGNRFVEPILAYADALVDGDPREVEAARELAAQHHWEFAR